MSKCLKISDDLSLPLDVITMRIALYGTSGSGKTTFARLMAEKVHEAKHRFCAIDLKNDWYGLKSSADGQSAGIPVVIFGGPRRDLQLFEDAGGAVAEAVAGIDQSVVIDLDELSKGKQLKFLIGFLERLYDVNRSPLILLADEADRYAPQKPMDNLGPIALGASEDICRRGRKRGIGSMWITQRTAIINKNITQICDLAVVFRTPGGIDLKELEKDVGRIVGKEDTAEVIRMAPGLENGQAIFLSSHPRLRKILPSPPMPIQLPLPWTFDSSATPALGHRRHEPRVLAETDLAQIEQKMAAQVERNKADDPKELRKRIAELQKQLKERPAETKAVKEVERRVEVPVLKNGQLARTEKVIERAEGIAAKLVAQIGELKKVVSPAFTSQTAMTKPVAAKVAEPAKKNAQNIPRASRATQAPPSCGSPNTHGETALDIGKSGMRRILIALAQNPDGLTPTKLSILTGIQQSGGTWRTYIGALRGASYIDGSRPIRITDAGLSALGDFDPLPTGPALIEFWRNRLGQSGKRRLFDVLVDAYPQTLTPAEASALSGMDLGGGTWRTYLGELRGLELVEGRGELRASAELFEE